MSASPQLERAVELFEKPANVQTRWISFENLTGDKGRGGMENRGAKGHSSESFPAGQTKTLCDISGAGVIRRMWMTINDRSPNVLRGVRLEIYWDGAAEPAVCCPLGDFFGVAHGELPPHENALFSSPDGRSFNCIIPMPFRTGCRMLLINESGKDVAHLFYDINYELSETPASKNFYFHTHWRRERPTALGEDFAILPSMRGEGRFLGCNVGVITSPSYGTGWWGEGEVKVYLDGDREWPTLVGTGAEDYIGTGWGMKKFFHPYQGCSVEQREAGRWAFYRFHIPDAIYFDRACRVTIQSMGGMPKRELVAAIEKGAAVKIATIAGQLAMDQPQVQLDDPTFGPDAWCNHYRQDDYCATAYFYLDRPINGLPPLPSVEERLAGISDAVETKRADV